MSRILIVVRRVMGDGKSRVVNVILRLVSGLSIFSLLMLSVTVAYVDF